MVLRVLSHAPHDKVAIGVGIVLLVTAVLVLAGLLATDWQGERQLPVHVCVVDTEKLAPVPDAAVTIFRGARSPLEGRIERCKPGDFAPESKDARPQTAATDRDGRCAFSYAFPAMGREGLLGASGDVDTSTTWVRVAAPDRTAALVPLDRQSVRPRDLNDRTPVYVTVVLGAAPAAVAPAPPKPLRPAGWGAATLAMGVVHREVGTVKLRMDIAVPPGKGPWPAIVFFPGGVPVQDSIKDCTGLMPFFLARGYVVAAAEYRSPGVAVFPAPIADAKHAIRFLRAHAGEYHIDPARIGAWGMSMGGGIVLMLAVTGDDFAKNKDELHGRFSSRVQAAVDRYGPADLTTFSRKLEWWPVMMAALGTFDPQRDELLRASPIALREQRLRPRAGGALPPGCRGAFSAVKGVLRSDAEGGRERRGPRNPLRRAHLGAGPRA